MEVRDLDWVLIICLLVAFYWLLKIGKATESTYSELSSRLNTIEEAMGGRERLENISSIRTLSQEEKRHDEE